MAVNQLDSRLIHVAKTLAQWKLITTIPIRGEVCLEMDSTTPPIKYKIKIGDGSLPYYQEGGVLGTDYLPYVEFTDADGNDFASVISSWIADNLDVNEFAQASYDNSTKTFSVYGIKEVDGKIVKGTNHLDLQFAEGTKIDLTSVNGVLTIAHETTTRTDTTGSNTDFGGSVVTGVTTDSTGHVTAVETSPLPTKPATKNIVGDSATATADAAAANPFLNHVEDGTVQSHHQIIGGTQIDSNSDSNGNITIKHGTISRTDTEENSQPTQIVTEITTSNGHVTATKTVDPDDLVVGKAQDLDSPVIEKDNTTWNHRITGGDINIGEDIAKIPVLKGNTIVWNQLVDSSATSVTLTSGNKYYTVIGGTKSIQTGAGSAISVTGGTDVVIDLTKLFGSDDQIVSALGVTVAEITTDKAIQAFEKLFPSDYYPYNEGELISLFDGSKSFNVWDEEWEVGRFDRNTGEKESNSNNIRSKNYIHIPIGATNFFVLCSNIGEVLCYDDNLNFLGLSSYTAQPTLGGNLCTLKAGTTKIAFYTAQSYGTTYNHDICINISNPEYNGLYLPYGEPLPFGIKSTGFNQWDEQWEDGYYRNNDGEKSPQNGYIRSANKIAVFPNTIYFVKTPASLVIKGYRVDGSYIGNIGVFKDQTFTTPSEVCYIVFNTAEEEAITTYNHDICINISDPKRDGIYETYKQNTLDLSWIKDIKDENDNQLFPYGLLSAGSAHDEVTETKAIKRVGKYTFTGNETWTLNGTYQGICNVDLPRKKSTDYWSGKSNCVHSKYIVGTQNSMYSGTELDTIGFTDSIAYGNICCGKNVYDNRESLTGTDFYYELETPIEIDIYPAKNMSYLVDDLGTETQLPVNPPTTTPITAPFVGTFEYKSNFRDTVIELIDKVNNAANPVKGVNNTDQTVDKIAIYDSVSTVHSSNYSPSNATIIEGATGNAFILPAVETIVNYVNTKLSSALTYKGTVATETELYSKESTAVTGDLYIASDTIVVNNDPISVTLPNGTYYAGTFFIWNETEWDVVSSTTTVINRNATLTPDGGTKNLANIDGTEITVVMPSLNFSEPTASGTTLDVIGTLSQVNGLISATKKTIQSASKSQQGVTQFVNDIHNSTDQTKAVTAGDAWTEFAKRNVRAVEVETVTSVSAYPSVLISTAAPSVSTVPTNWDNSIYGTWTGAPQFLGQLFVSTSGVASIATGTTSINDWQVITNV